MGLPKIDVPVYEITLPISGKKVKYRPFLIKEQKNLMMALESGEFESIQQNIRQILINCTLSSDIDVDDLAVIDAQYYFIKIRSKSVGEIVDLQYRCNNEVSNKTCGNLMEYKLNLDELSVEKPNVDDLIKITDKVSLKLKYPQFGLVTRENEFETLTELTFASIVNAIDYIYDGDQFYYAKESTQEELTEFIESLNVTQFANIEKFFQSLPILEKDVSMTCNKCGFIHNIHLEGIEDFFV
jgi:hypothetical protein